MISKKYHILLIISLVFNLAFISSFIFRGIQIAKYDGRPFPRPFERPPVRNFKGPRGPEHRLPHEMKKKLMSTEIKDNICTIEGLKKQFFQELMKDNPSYTKLDSLKTMMSDRSQVLSESFSSKLIEIRKSSSIEETKKYRDAFDGHIDKRYPHRRPKERSEK